MRFVISFYKKISNIGIRDSTSELEARRVRLVNRINLLCCFFTFGFVPLMYFFNMRYYIPFQVGSGIICLSGFLFCSKGWYDVGAMVIILTLCFNLIWCSLCYHGTGVEYFFFPLTTIPFAAFRKKSLLRLTAGLCITGYFSYYFLRGYVAVKGVIPEPFLGITNFTVMAAAFASLLICIGVLKAANDRYEQSILEQKVAAEEQRELIAEKQKEILDSIHYAKRIQRALITNEKYFEKTLYQLKQKPE